MESKKTFMARVEPWLTASDLVRVRGAYYMAKYGHRGQVRKEQGPDGLPLRYFEHPRRVALILMDEVDCHDPDIIITCLLHDCLEDSPDIDAGIVEQFFGKRVAQLVRLLTKDPREGYLERVCSDLDALLVKMCDRIDNLRSLPKTDQGFQDKQLTETLKYIYRFNLEVDEHMHPWYMEGLQLLRDAYHKAGGASL